MTWNFLLEIAIKKEFEKLNHLRRVIHRTTKKDQMHIVENIYILCGLLCVKCLEPRTTVSSTLGKTAKIMFKMDNCRSVLGDKEYIESLVRNRWLLPVSYFLLLNDLILLNKILVGLTSMNASDHCSITFGCSKTRSSEKTF